MLDFTQVHTKAQGGEATCLRSEKRIQTDGLQASSTKYDEVSPIFGNVYRRYGGALSFPKLGISVLRQH